MTHGDSVINHDSTIFESAQRDEQPVLVKLSGEFDIRYRRTLANTLRDCLASGRSTLVDLSEVTFMDSRCLWELAVYYQLGSGRIILCNPSRHVGVSVAACDLEDWIDVIYTTDLRLPPGYAAGSISQNAARKTRKGNCPCINYTQR
jgi:anti-anti-sigma factor